MTDLQEQWAVFWCSLLAPLLYGDIDPSEAGRFLRQLTEQPVEFPDGTRRRPSRATLWRKYKQYRQGGFESLFRKRRGDRGKARKATPQMMDKAVQLKKEQPLRSDQPINEFFRHQFQAEIPKSTLYRHLKEHGATRRKLGVTRPSTARWLW